MNLLQDGKRPVVREVEEVGVVDGEAVAGGGEGGDERGGHEAVEEVELLGAGDAGTPGEAERQRVPRDGPRCALHRRRRLRVQLPPLILVHHPPHPPQHRRRLGLRRMALFLE
uniref:Uncharacterized protein n=1 Tax=Arundo donax TaxID=35708 RepID=A0A0A9F636_ARUDO